MTNKKRKGLCGLLLIILIIQIFFINFVLTTKKNFDDNQQNLMESKAKMNSVLIQDTVRRQQDNMLSSLKQSWAKYLEINNNENLILKDDKGYPIYCNELNVIAFNESTMYKKSTDNNLFNIYDSYTNELLEADCKPKWDSKKVTETLSLLITPNKLFGNNGGMIVFDSNTGEIFEDTTPQSRLKNNSNNIFNDDQYVGNKNVKDTKDVIDNVFKRKKDSISQTDLVYMINESTDMGKDKSNFKLYPLGQYNRQFIEMSILPYETIGYDGQPMQLTILSVVDEQDIHKAYEQLDINDNNIININHNLYIKIYIFLALTTFITMLGMTVVLYFINNAETDDEK